MLKKTQLGATQPGSEVRAQHPFTLPHRGEEKEAASETINSTKMHLLQSRPWILKPLLCVAARAAKPLPEDFPPLFREVADSSTFDHGDILMAFFPELHVPCFSALLVVVGEQCFVYFHPGRLDHIPTQMDDPIIFLDRFAIYRTIFRF